MADLKKKENEEELNEQTSGEEKEIDLLELAYKLWDQRKLILVWCLGGIICGLVIAFSIPREYTTSVKLAPESTNNRAVAGGLGALASMAGISAGATTGADAVNPSLYPEVVSSVPFATSLFDVEVTTKKDDKKYTVREYIQDEIKAPWWKAVMGLPGKAMGLLRSKPAEDDEEHVLDNFELTPEEAGLVGVLTQRVSANVDSKTNVITIEVEMQDPLVSAILADTVVSRLQEYVSNYRTNKARKDLEYAEKLNEEAREEYYRAQQRLADFIDRNQNLATRSAQINQDRLENESSLAFNLFNQTSTQVQTAKAKVQENTPVYTVLTPATVPMRPTSPKKGLIIAGFTFLAFVACSAWILFGQPLVGEYKNKKAELDALKAQNADEKKASEE